MLLVHEAVLEQPRDGPSATRTHHHPCTKPELSSHRCQCSVTPHSVVSEIQRGGFDFRSGFFRFRGFPVRTEIKNRSPKKKTDSENGLANLPVRTVPKFQSEISD